MHAAGLVADKGLCEEMLVDLPTAWVGSVSSKEGALGFNACDRFGIDRGRRGHGSLCASPVKMGEADFGRNDMYVSVHKEFLQTQLMLSCLVLNSLPEKTMVAAEHFNSGMNSIPVKDVSLHYRAC